MPTPSPQDGVVAGLIQWLCGFAEIIGAERITPDQPGADELALMPLPEDLVSTYIDGSRDITRSLLFRVRLASLTHAQRLSAHSCLDALSQRIWRRVLGGDLPCLGPGREAQSLRVTQPPYLLQPDGADAVYQLGLEINYIERRA